MLKRLIAYVLATRPWSFIMSVISVSVGTLLAAEAGDVSWFWFAVTVVGIVCFHASANLFNDFFDTRYAVDQADSPTAKYRPQPIVSGLMSSRQVLLEALWLLVMTVALGMLIAFERAPQVLWIGVIGALTSYFYTAGPIKFKYRGMGEVAVFLMWGPLMVEGAYAVQRHILSLKALYVSVPFGLLVALVILANNMRDRAYDERCGIATICVRLGDRRSFQFFTGLLVMAYVCMALLVAFQIISLWGLLVFLSLPKAIALIRQFKREIPDAADALAAQLDTIFGILLIVALLLGSGLVL